MDGLIKGIVADLDAAAQRLGRPARLMEVCGTHTMVAFRSGLRRLLPPDVRLTSGPGCPVCVTPPGYVDAAIEMGRLPGITIATFGDLVRVPGSVSSLEQERAQGIQVRVVYSPIDALALAKAESARTVVFLAVGFETTTPAVALTVKAAREQGVSNYLVLAAHKTMPGAMEALVRGGDVLVDGFLCPGHVSVVAGAKIFSFLADTYGIPCVVAGFEPEDILEGINMLLTQLGEGRSAVEIGYERAVTWEGNTAAQKVTAEVFVEGDSEWRGLGVIPGSGMVLRPEYSEHDAALRLGVKVEAGRPMAGCRCGDVLRGSLEPPECPLFGRSCTLERPLGPCMVSSEGSCAAHARYGGGGKS
jgi:hydrogenase expression/formation protein HypD